ncbi:hypothetical protein BX666DRAFT_1973972 [Dichotomocladium elegans]|nr:hypothetical protein BX666DRAFT_1973972 [Dichotomocladium elegans]
MSDLNWCPVCDKAIHPSVDSLYCSQECLQHDALNRNPLLGYDFYEFQDFLKPSSSRRRFSIRQSPPSSPSSIQDHPLSPAASFYTTITSASSDEEDLSSPLVLTPTAAFPIMMDSPPKLDLGKPACHYGDYHIKHPAPIQQHDRYRHAL